MNIWKISLLNLRSKPLYTLLSVFTLALSIALLLGIQQLKRSFEYQTENNLGDVELVIGAKGSPLQLVLSSVLHLDNPTGNISLREVKKFMKNPLVKRAVPLSYGDNFKGYRIVGTTADFLDIYKANIDQGRALEKSMEVLLGSSVAAKLNLKLGDTFSSAHGLVENEVEVHEEAFVVVGILSPTQKVIDRLILTKLESVWEVHEHEDHEQDGHEHEYEEEKEITSLLLSFRNPSALLSLPRRINQDTNMMAALPKYEMNRLYEFTGVGFQTIAWIAYFILCMAGLTIFLNFYKMIKDRAFDLALLRSYGASNIQLIRMVAYEGLMIVAFAFLLGYALTRLGLYFLIHNFESGPQGSFLVALPFSQVISIIGLVLVMAILSIGVAIIPVFRMNISTILSNEK